MKKISIMLTSYNLVDYIDESISSVVCQEMPCDWELLIGDDGSNDGTIEKLKQWQERDPKHIRYYVNERPKTTVKDGYRAAKNRASLLEKATGDYLIYLDGDDCWLGFEKLKTQFAILEDPANSDCSCCAHNIQAYVIPEERKYSWEDEGMPTQKMSLEQYWSYHYFHTNTLLFRQECKEMLLDSLYRDHLNDNLITFIVLQYGKVYYLDKVWARYNMTGSGLWTGHSNTYGTLRNITLYDLEMRICPQLKRNHLRKHCGNILYLLRHFKPEDYEGIIPVIKPLDPKVFKNTILLSKVKNVTLYDRIQRVKLYLDIYLFLISNKFRSLIKKGEKKI